MLTDYKFKLIRRNDKGLITEAIVSFYEGDFQTIKDQQIYVRFGKLRDAVFKPKDFQGKESDTAFSKIDTDLELMNFVNLELKKDLTRTPINEQKATK